MWKKVNYSVVSLEENNIADFREKQILYNQQYPYEIYMYAK